MFIFRITRFIYLNFENNFISKQIADALPSVDRTSPAVLSATAAAGRNRTSAAVKLEAASSDADKSKTGHKLVFKKCQFGHIRCKDIFGHIRVK